MAVIQNFLQVRPHTGWALAISCTLSDMQYPPPVRMATSCVDHPEFLLGETFRTVRTKVVAEASARGGGGRAGHRFGLGVFGVRRRAMGVVWRVPMDVKFPVLSAEGQKGISVT